MVFEKKFFLAEAYTKLKRLKLLNSARYSSSQKLTQNPLYPKHETWPSQIYMRLWERKIFNQWKRLHLDLGTIRTQVVLC